jgi:hypothetical protein
VTACPYADVKVGERAFTIGAPRGLELINFEQAARRGIETVADQASV